MEWARKFIEISYRYDIWSAPAVDMIHDDKGVERAHPPISIGVKVIFGILRRTNVVKGPAASAIDLVYDGENVEGRDESVVIDIKGLGLVLPGVHSTRDAAEIVNKNSVARRPLIGDR